MIISFEGPVFFSSMDEDHFLDWLRSLPEFQSINGAGTILELGLSQPVQPETIRELLVIFRRWHLDVAPLLPLRSSESIGFVLWDTGSEEAAVRTPQNFRANGV
ncbi:hypothetical protein D3C71_1693930 [compost metagenome]